VYDAASVGTASPTFRDSLVVSSSRNTELCLLFISLKIEKNEVGWACSSDGEVSGVYRILVGKPEGKRSLGRPRRRWEDNIKMDLKEVRCGVWTGLSWLRLDTGGRRL
jgi:hypothetical protein